MLLLTRKPGESLVIEVEGVQEPIELSVLEVGGQVRLGINAPESCRIWRKELYQIIQANRQAAQQPAVTQAQSLAQCLRAGKCEPEQK